MSDEKTGRTRIIAAGDIVEFFVKRSTKPCPACGYNKWTIVSPLAEDGTEVLSLNGIAVETTKGVGKALPLISAVCSKCAYIRSHAHYAVLDWVEKGKPDFIDDEL